MKDKFWIGFSSIESLSSKFIQRLYNYFGDIEQAFNSNLNDLKNIDGLSVKTAETFLRKRDTINLDDKLAEVRNKDINFLTFEDKDYPYLLKQIDSPPVVLYYKGDINLCNFEKTLAVVGSRRASINGKLGLKKIISEMRNTDICIVSGLATGIDTTAHESAIENNLKTIGVIASGFDFIYPTKNKLLYEKIENGSGVIFTEYYPTFEPLPYRFPLRNRIVTGLSYGTLVVEAALKSGALISANLTLEQGRELMCMPGAINNPNTQGIYKLLKDGATMVTNANDILNALNWELIIEKNEEKNDFSKEEESIINAIKIEPETFDIIQQKTNLKTQDLLTSLTMLELKGIINQVNGDRYTIS